ncbi:MAG: molybdenum cofactor guanylyltransferase MobA [Sulfurimonas sp.]|jgi:molybdopterin-guanine dinucleotide biosynthesis protein A|nr:molybdenum cofactor guanylyltransferase MobA [Sulfurimonas sp.]MBU1217749.1 molybdenum cofactor guanylyltransferase MobA [bacterium]MBU1434223.1 molybdenum cofactor guanylyltransferase MobA [bacterium]MBU1504318.1 molybdenum cofactor guanylyltransferase MobA [bacterium]MBU3939432.1 molybdenum cofactor guanylyltransferase MobA [bacterium]
MLDMPCVIFAGGKSSRMGEDKALLPFSSFKTLTEFQYSRLSKIFKTVYISCKDKNKFDFDAAFIEDVKTNKVFAPTAGFVAVFKALQSDAFFALSVDAPFVSETIIQELIESDSRINADASIATSVHGMEPMCGIYHRSLEAAFNTMLDEDNHKLGLLLKSSKTNFVHFDDKQAFLNLNHPHEYQEALTLV